MRTGTSHGLASDKSSNVFLANAVMLSLAFFLVFTAFSAVQNLEGSVVSGHCQGCANFTSGPCKLLPVVNVSTNAVCSAKPKTHCGLRCPEGYEECDSSHLGTYAMAVLYLVFTISCIGGPAVVNVLGPKWSIVVGFTAFCLFCAANVVVATFPQKSTLDVVVLIPSSAMVGLAASFLWTAQGSYLTSNAAQYARVLGREPAETLGLFNGLFFAIFQLTQISGNLAASLLLNEANWPTSRLFIFYLCCAGGGTLLACFLRSVDDGDGRKDPSEGSVWDSVVRMVSLWKDRRMMLLIPLIAYSGLEQGFMWGDFTTNYVRPSVGTANIGFVMAAFGFADVVGSISLGKLSDMLGRPMIIAFGAACHGSIGGYLVYVRSSDLLQECDKQWTRLLVCSAVWGLGDAVWNTQLNAIIGSLFTKEKTGAFANYKLWQSITVASAFFYSAHLNVVPKLIIMLTLLVVGLTGYVLLLATTPRSPVASERPGSSRTIDGRPLLDPAIDSLINER